MLQQNLSLIQAERPARNFMPRFDFRCTDCQYTFEELLLPGGTTPRCRHCGSAKIEKLLSPPSVIFKGTGFYRTDSTKARGASTPEPSEAKPDAKTEAPKATENPPPKLPGKELAPKKRDT